MCSSSDLAALSRLKTFADSLPVVRAVATCPFDEGLAFPSEVDLAVATTGLTIPFAKVSLLNEIRINLSCPVPAKDSLLQR